MYVVVPLPSTDDKKNESSDATITPELVARTASIKGACNDTQTSNKRSTDNTAASRSAERGEKS